MAQALVGFPAMTKGASLMDYILTFEKLVSEYKRVALTKCDENLQIGTLLKGIPQELRRHLLVDMTGSATYAEVRSRLLEYEKRSQTWSAENILSSLSVANPTSHRNNEYKGPIPMEIDRAKGKKGDKGRKGDGKSKGKYGKGKGYGAGYGRGRGGKSKGRGRYGKGRGRGGKGGKHGKSGGKQLRQVGKGYGGGKGSDKGKGKGSGPTCYNCGKQGHIAAECYSKSSGKGGCSKSGKGKVRQVYGEEEWNQSQRQEQGQGQWQNWNNVQANNQETNQKPQQQASQGNVRVVQQATGTERVRRIEESTVMIEEVEDEVVDLIDMFNDMAANYNVRMVKNKPAAKIKAKAEAKAQVRDQDEEDPIGEDESPTSSDEDLFDKTNAEVKKDLLEYALVLLKDYLKNMCGDKQKHLYYRKFQNMKLEWSSIKDENDLTQMVLDYLEKERAPQSRKIFLTRMEAHARNLGQLRRADRGSKEDREQGKGDGKPVYWSHEKQDWVVKCPIDLPSPGFTDSEAEAIDEEMEEEDDDKDEAIEMPRGSKDPDPKRRIRRVEMFDIGDEDEEEETMVIDDLMACYLDVEIGRIRTVYHESYDEWNIIPVEVVLDSGAGCHVLPLSYYSDDLGTKELPELRMVISDAQGNLIRATETRANITFEFTKEGGKAVKVNDSAVFGQVTQPLFAVGSMEDRLGYFTMRCSHSMVVQRQHKNSNQVCSELNGI